MEKAISQNSTSIYNTQKDSTEPKYAIPNNKKINVSMLPLVYSLTWRTFYIY
jgi:hypothetical protein